MKKINILAILLLILTVGCGTIKPIPVETIYNYKDSVIVHVDSIAVDVPVERYVDLVNYTDTLVLETSVAKATAYADTTTRTLKGRIENKPVQLKKEIVYQDRIIEKEVTKEVPVYIDKEVVKYKHYFYEKILWFLSLLAGVMIGRKLYPIVKKWLAIL